MEGGAEVVGVGEGLELADEIGVGGVTEEPGFGGVGEVSALVGEFEETPLRGGFDEGGEIDVGGEVLEAGAVERMVVFGVFEIGAQGSVFAGG